MIASRFLRASGLALALVATGAFAADYGSSTMKSGTATGQEAKPGMTQGNTTTGASTASQAAGTDATKTMTFDQLDKNHDSYIDKSEAAAMPGLSGVFDKYDKSKKGKLDRAEFDQASRGLSQAAK